MNSLIPVIVCAADNRYAMPLAVMLRSVAEHLPKGTSVKVWVMDGGISRWNKRKIVSSLPLHVLQIQWVTVDAGLLVDMPVFGHVSLSTYYRFLLGAILPPDIDKVIYLDVDTIVLGDIFELWNTPMDSHTLLAVPGRIHKVGDMLDPAIIEGNGLKPDGAYFNAGVMLIDLARWRAGNLLDRARAFVNQYGRLLRFWDQDIFNCLLTGDWGYLDEKWNRIIDHQDKLEETDLRAYQKAGGLVHFASAIKPWTWWADHSAKSLYFVWVDRTSWRNWRPRAPLGSTIGNKHWYGKLIRGIPGIGHVWGAIRKLIKGFG